MRSIPNILTFSRLLGIPFLLYLLATGVNKIDYWWAAGFFIVLSITDALDGWLARKLKAESDLGKLLDPLVDKLLVIAPLIFLVEMRSQVNGAPIVPSWMVILLVAREIWVTGLRAVAASRGAVVPASDLGKIKTVLQIAALFFLILYQERFFMIQNEWITGQYLGLQVLMGSLVISYWGAFEYSFSILKSKKNPSRKLTPPTSILKKRAC
jgi:CDP-diacylglycerol--glycerol-3-phosphate 3-phosphatidyltransferase